MTDFFIIIACIVLAVLIGFTAGQKLASIKPKCEVYSIPAMTGQWCVKHDKQGNVYYSRKNIRVYLD